ncbi:restriction endonuclease subunit S [Corynebacterium sp. HMSC14B06]|uniref:restriction endonuclease subunit S n=1 Tax=Corynebacterium sp. HMSC14B06 TaxID=1581098 RepID=UPI0008A2AE1C|nr:restriction endonuclease subunit S [Corynebacterium sp. HMSC14B06]
MNQIEKLIEELCPDGVEYKPLGSLGVRNKGIPITAKKMRDIADNTGDIKIFAGGKTSVQARSTSIESKGIIYKPSIIVKSRGYIGFEYYDQPFTHKSELWSYSINENGNINQKFVFYYLTTKSPQLQEYARATSVKIPQLSVKDTDTLPIPIPPLIIQNEIVKILDTFQSLEAELEAELEARKKQYEFYRDQLLTFTERERVRWATLGEVSQRVSSGATPAKSNRGFYQGGKIPWLRTQEVVFNEIYSTNEFITEQAVAQTGAHWIPENCLIVAISGASAGRCAVNKIPLTTNQHCCNIEIDETAVNFKFAFYWTAAQYEELKALGRGARSDLNSKIIKNFRIPIPPLEEQQRIVNILDKFDALVNDLTSGLPAEIEARRQQYEYYRDQLLTFKELAA